MGRAAARRWSLRSPRAARRRGEGAAGHGLPRFDDEVRAFGADHHRPHHLADGEAGAPFDDALPVDLRGLPKVGAVAHIPVHVFRDDEGVFRLFFPQEYGDYFVEVVLDAAEGLA